MICGAGLTTPVILHLGLPPYRESDRVPVLRVAASRRDLVEECGGLHSQFAAKERQGH